MRHTRRREQTRARLLEAAAEVFAEHGLRGTSVDRLTRAAGFTRGAFYSNFSSLEEVFAALVQEQARDLLDRARAAVASVPDDAFSLETVAEVLARTTPEDRTWYLVHLELLLAAGRDGSMRATLQEQDRALRAELDEVVGEVARRLGRRPVVPIAQVSEVLVALYLHGVGNDHLGTGTTALEDLIATILPRVFWGLTEPAG